MKAKAYVLLWVLISIGALMLATNVFALMIQDPAVLGPPHIGNLYEPFHIFWWLFVVRGAPGEMQTAFAIFGITSFFSGILLIRVYKRSENKINDTYGSSRWMSNAELKKSGALVRGGIVFCQTNEAKYKYEPKTDRWKMLKKGKIIFNNSKEHVLVVAPTRRGKGINFVIPGLLSWTGSVVCYDIKKENWDITSGWRSKFSHTIRFEPTAEYTPRFNPLLEIEPGDREVPMAQNVVEILTDPYGTAKDDHWRNTGRQLLLGVVLHVLYAEEDKTLGGLYRFINDPDRDINEILELMLETKHLGNKGTHPVVAQTARNMLNKAEKELSSVVSTVSSYLSLYQDPVVQKATSASDFRVDDLMNAEHPVSLYYVVSPQDADRLVPLTRLVFQLIGTKLTAKLGGYKHRLLFLIDEFPTLGALEFFEKQLAFFAGYGIKCALITQSFSQLYKHYSQNTSIPDNCKYKIFLGADSPTEAKLISEFLGQETLMKKSTTRSGQISKFIMSNKSESASEVGRSLLTPDEVLRFPFNEVLLLTGGGYPYRGAKIMYFLDKRFDGRVKLDPPEEKQQQERYLPALKPNPWGSQGAPVVHDAALPAEPAGDVDRDSLELEAPAVADASEQVTPDMTSQDRRQEPPDETVVFVPSGEAEGSDAGEDDEGPYHPSRTNAIPQNYL
jgi:type IV secretion system protein VirD4